MYLMNVNPAEKWTTDGNGAGFRPRQLGADDRGNVYICAQASGAIPDYEMCFINQSGQAIKATTANGDDEIGSAMGACQITLADDEFGWFLIFGVGRVDVGASCAADSLLYTTTTGGRLDDAAGSNMKIIGIHLTTARGTGNGDAPCVMNWPHTLGSTT